MLATLALLLAVTSAPAPQVCTFARADEENPFTRWLNSKDVKCGPATPEDIQNAARISAMLNSGERGVIYATRSATAVPLAADGATVVPAGQELWLFTIGESGPAGIVTIAPLETGSEKPVDARQPEPGAVIGWLHVPESERQAVANARSLSSPALRAGNRQGDVPAPLANLNGTFVRLRKVPEGDAELEFGGRGWLPQRRSVKVKGALTRLTEPLLARPSATLLVDWSTNGDLAALDASIGTCTQKDEVPHLEITLSSCKAPERGAPVDPNSCRVIRTETPAGNTFGSFLVEDLYPGFYRAQITYGKLPAASMFANAPGAVQTPLHVGAVYVTLEGNLAKGGETINDETHLRFPGGVGFARSGKYKAVLLERFPRILPTDTQIDVVQCRGSKAVALTDTTVRLNGRYDIDLPDNELIIKVEDTFTHEALAAPVRYALMSRGFPFRPVLTGTIAMDAPYDGARMQSVPQREMRIQVSAPGYQKKDVERFTMDKSERKTISVQLMPLEGSAGTIVSPAPFDSATIYWFTANGEETEHADVASDGTFVFARKHDSSETMVIVSASHPLWAAKSPVMRRGDTIKLPFPPQSRSFEVIAKGPSAFLTVAMGGVRVPLAAFREHQQLRRNPPTTQPGRVLPVTDIAAVGTLDVLLGPAVEVVAPRVAAFDVFTLPQFKIVTRRLEPDQTTVSFVP